MASKIMLAKDGDRLAAADPWSAEYIDGMTQGEIVNAEITRIRNVRFHRKFFAFLNLVYKNQSKYIDLEDMLEAMKEAVGHGRYIDRLDGRGNFFRSKSISFAKMDEDKFRKFYDAYVAIVVRHILPGIDDADLEREVEAFLV